MAGSGSYFINYGYTFRNQLNTINGEGGAWAFNYVYDASGNMTTRQAQYNGRTSSTFCPPTETYDALNRPTAWSQTGPNGFSKSSHYQYDQANREKATWRDEDGGTGERFEYEASNQLKKVSYSMPAPAPSPTPSATPTPPGASPTPPNATPTPGQQVNEVTFTQTTGGAGNVLVTMRTTTADAVIFFTHSATDYPPDPTHTGSTAGSGTTRYVAPFSVANGTVQYFKALAYHEGMTDSDITEWLVDNGDGPNAVGRTVTYEYTPDKLNRSSVTDNGVTTLYSPNRLNQYTSVAGNSLSYDNNFNLTHTVGFNGIYDAGNLLVAASNGGSGEAQQTIAGFIYDGLGRCVKRTFNGVGTILVYDGWKPIAEWDATVPGYFQAWNVYGPGSDEILLRQGGKYGYMRFHLDRHGNVAFLVDNDGVVQEKYTYDVFGKPKIMDAAGTERPFSYYGHCFLFQGREYIRALGIYDYRHRFYNPELGNFIQVDPLGLQTEGAKLSADQKALYATGAAPDTFSTSEMNLYRYCYNDPINKSDPTGLYIEYTTGSAAFWQNWAQQFAARWQDAGFRDWWNKAAPSRDAYVVGPEGSRGASGRQANPTLPHTMARANDGSSAAQRAQNVPASPQGRAPNVTHYAYPNDPNSDSGSRLGLGTHNNILNPDSVALSPDQARGIRFGGRVEIGGRFIGFYHDATSPSLTNRVDIYDPSNIYH